VGAAASTLSPLLLQNLNPLDLPFYQLGLEALFEFEGGTKIYTAIVEI
jgi:hypothetical protein